MNEHRATIYDACDAPATARGDAVGSGGLMADGWLPARAEIFAEYDARCIRIWRFEEAPMELQQYSDHGGDEDWIIVVPAGVAVDHGIDWITAGSTPFGRYTQHYTLHDGSVIAIAAHS